MGAEGQMLGQRRLARRYEMAYGLLVPAARAMTPAGADQVVQLLAAAGIRSTTAPSAPAVPGPQLRRTAVPGLLAIQILVFPEDAELARRRLWAQTAEVTGEFPLRLTGCEAR